MEFINCDQVFSGAENDGIVSAMMFLDKRSFFTQLRTESLRFQRDAEKHIFKISISIPIFDLMEENAMLCEKVLHHPQEASVVFTDLVYLSLCALRLLPCNIDITQILVLLRLDALPPFREYQLLSVQDLCKNLKEKRYFEVQGILSSLSSPSKYSMSARYYCQDEECTFNKGNKVIRVYVPGATEGETISRDFSCKSCGSELKEDLKCRTLGEKVVAGIILGIRLHTNVPTVNCQPVFVSARDELTQDLQLGEKYVVNGIPISFQDENSYFGFEACNVQRFERPVPKLNLLPDNIQQLYYDSQSSPWRFALNLASLFGAEILQEQQYQRLKLGLLLNLVAENNAESQCSSRSMLIICKDDLLVNRFLKYAAQFSERCVEHSVLFNITGHVKGKQNGYVVTAGSLLLASGGVCIVGTGSLTSRPIQETLSRVLETGTVTIDIPHQLSGEFGKQLVYPLTSSIWACGLSLKKRSTKTFSVVDCMMDLGSLQKSFVNSFGMVYILNNCDTGSDKVASSVSSQHILNLAVNCGTDDLAAEYCVQTESWEHFLEYARQQKVLFQPDAKQLIQGYYLASRRVRSSAGGDCDLPLSAVSSITLLAEGYAKLSLHSEVTQYDAMMAILIYEESLVSRYGPSVLLGKAFPHTATESSSGKEEDDFFYSFHKSVQHFIMNYAGVLLSEE